MPRFSDCWRCGKSSVTVACPSCNVAKYCSNKCKENDIARHNDAECRPISIIKRCSSCSKTGSSLQTCNGCYQAFYCDANCQKNHWPGHKVECKRVADKIKSLANVLNVYFSVADVRGCSAHYFWGNVPAYDYLNLSENEGIDYNSDINLLVLGVGDLRNIVLTSASLPQSFKRKLRFVLNDSDRYVLARLVLLLYMMIKCDASVTKVITEIWYSLSLSEKSYTYLCSSLQGLLRFNGAEDFKSATNGLICLNEDHIRELQDVWKRWLDLRVKGTKIIQKQREELMNADSESFAGKFNYYNSIPQQHVSSAKKYMEDGVFQQTQLCSFAENPTLTAPSVHLKNGNFTYCCQASVLPFVGWDYIEVKKSIHEASLVTMFGNYINIKLSALMEKLILNQVSFVIILGDCMNIEEYLDDKVTYDRILTSNLMDYILLPNLLSVYSTKLNRNNPFATLITESQNWVDFCPDADVNSTSSVSLSNTERISNLCTIAMRDTNEKDHTRFLCATTFREYLDNSHEFHTYLRALFFVYRKRDKQKASLPILKDLGSEFQLKMRDGFRNENRIVFFKPAVNRRRVTMITGFERFLEWVAR